ncbi:hypothetical protein BDN67DRAFT_416309 [Paxillus ammoniavirescens]|nr:hypothetical protein BDN67DRAFT_416309 [Paxillus ammoniavirescens]
MVYQIAHFSVGLLELLCGFFLLADFSPTLHMYYITIRTCRSVLHFRLQQQWKAPAHEGQGANCTRRSRSHEVKYYRYVVVATSRARLAVTLLATYATARSTDRMAVITTRISCSGNSRRAAQIEERTAMTQKRG